MHSHPYLSTAIQQELIYEMTKTIGVSNYWFEWMAKIVDSQIRKSKSEIVEEGLKTIQYGLDRAAQELDNAKAIAEQKIEGEE